MTGKHLATHVRTHKMARRRNERTDKEKVNRGLRKSAVHSTFSHTTVLASEVEAATNGLLTVIGQPRNTVPFQRLFELLSRATVEPAVAVFARAEATMKVFLETGALGDDAAAVLRSVIKNRGRLLGPAAATSEACSEALNFVIAAV